LEETGNLRFDVIPGLHHGLLVSSQREALSELLTHYVLTNFTGAPEPELASIHPLAG